MTSIVDQVNRTPVSYIVVVAYMTFAVVAGIIDTDLDKLMEFGAARGVEVASGEVWRLIAYAFLHHGLLHLAMNTMFLAMIGPTLENDLGSARFTLVYVVTAVAGGAAGNLWHDPLAPLVGGSGAMFGLAGTAMALNMRRGRHLLDFMNYQGPRVLAMLVGANLLLGMFLPMISNAAHIGGLIAGFALTFCFLAPRRDGLDRVGWWIRGGWIALFVGVVLYCANPVARPLHLFLELQEASTEDRGDLARALLRRDPQMTFLRYLDPKAWASVDAEIRAMARE